MQKIWAVEPEFLTGYLETILNVGDISKKEISAFFDANPVQDEKIFSIDGDTAIINIKGILSQDGLDFIDRFFGFGGTGYIDILNAIDEIKVNEDVKTVRLVMNTPGGTVDGVDKVFQSVSELAKVKHVHAESHGLIASAGYWIASAANKITATSPSDEIGSIGVVIVAIDRSKSREERGVKVVVIRSENAPKKQPDISTQSGRNTLQERVDSLERVFIGRISEGRGIPVETIEKNFARGSVLIAEDPDSSKDDALSVGMIDKVESVVSPALAPKDKRKKATSQNIKNPISQQEENSMNLAELMAKDPVLAQEISARDNIYIAKGVVKEKLEAKARIEKCKPYIVSDAYPKTVTSLAIDVLSGKSEFSALEAAVTVLDALKEQKNSSAAGDETNAQSETLPENQDGDTAPEGVCRTNEEFDVMMAE